MLEFEDNPRLCVWCESVIRVFALALCVGKDFVSVTLRMTGLPATFFPLPHGFFQVILELTKQQKEEETILVFNVTQLGTEATMRTFDLTAVSYLRKISLDYHEIKGNGHENRNSTQE